MPHVGGVNKTIDNSYLCKAGYYCKVNSELFPCPKGYYCPIGSSHPYPCTFGLMTCPNDLTATANVIGGMLSIIYVSLDI